MVFCGLVGSMEDQRSRGLGFNSQSSKFVIKAGVYIQNHLHWEFPCHSLNELGTFHIRFGVTEKQY